MIENIVASTALTVAKAELTAPEKRILKALEQAEHVSVLVPDDIKAEEFRAALGGICKQYVKAEVRREMLFPVLGQLMLVAKQHPELWNENHKNYEAFIEATEKEFGVSRATLYEARKTVERWGEHLDMDEFPMIGRVRLKKISRLPIPAGTEGEKVTKGLLKIAATGTVEKMNEFIESNFHISAGEQVGGSFVIPCNKSQQSKWTKFFDRAEVQAYVGSEKWSIIMDCLIAECGQEWLDKGEQKMAAVAEQGAA